MSQGLYPIRSISAMTGVNPVTLRAWERRYGLIRPQRTPKGHRLYTERDIDRIKQILVLLDRGIPISQARQALEGESAAPPGAPASAASPDDTAWSALIARMHTAVSVYDERLLNDALDEALSLFPAAQVRYHLLEALYRHHAGDDDARQGGESAFLRGWLGVVLSTRLRHRSHHATGPRLLLAATPGSDGAVPLLLLALEAIDRGYRVVLLAGGPTTEALAAAARDSGADAVLLWTDQGSAPAIGDAHGVPVFLVGAAAAHAAADGACTPLPGDTRDVLGALDTRYASREQAPA